MVDLSNKSAGYIFPKSSSPGKRSDTNRLTGVVTGSTGIYYEQRGFDICRFASKSILFLILLPFLTALCLILLAISIVFGIFRLSPLSVFFNTLNPLLTFKLFAVIFPFHFSSRKIIEVPVRTMRLLEGDKREHEVMIKGFVKGGYPREGDKVMVAGRWKDGVLEFRDGFNYNINAGFRLCRSPWPAVLFILLSLLTGAGIWISTY